MTRRRRWACLAGRPDRRAAAGIFRSCPIRIGSGRIWRTSSRRPPVAAARPGRRPRLRRSCQGSSAFNEACRAAALPAAPAALALAARQVAPPAVVPGAAELRVDEALDGLVGDHLATLLALRAGQRSARATDPLASRSMTAARKLSSSLRREPFQRRAAGLLVGVTGPVSDLTPRYCASAPRQIVDGERSRSRRDLPDRAAIAESRAISHRSVQGKLIVLRPMATPPPEVLHFVCELRGPITTGACDSGDNWRALPESQAAAYGPRPSPGRHGSDRVFVEQPLHQRGIEIRAHFDDLAVCEPASPSNSGCRSEDRFSRSPSTAVRPPPSRRW